MTVTAAAGMERIYRRDRDDIVWGRVGIGMKFCRDGWG